MQNSAPLPSCGVRLRYAESLIRNEKSVKQHSQFKIEIKKIEKMDDFSFEDAGDQPDDDIAEAIRVSLVEAMAPSPHSEKKTVNQGMFSNKVNFFYVIV